MKVNSVSKSALVDYGKCAKMAKLKKSDPRPNVASDKMNVGILGHEVAAREVAALFGIQRGVSENYSLEVLFEVQEKIGKYTKFNELYNNMSLIGLEYSVSLDMPEIGEGFRFNGRFDAICSIEINHQSYIVIDDFKTGYHISTAIDSEALIYAYVAQQLYGLPVVFRRIGLMNGKVWSHTFSIDSINKMKESILLSIKMYKMDMESDMVPEWTPGGHCLYCPYLMSCQGRKSLKTINDRFKVAIWAKNVAKFNETLVKIAAKEVLDNSSGLENGAVLIPFINGGYGAVVSVSESYGLKGRKIKKSDVIRLLIETGEIDKYIDCLDLKMSEELANELKKVYKMPTQKTTKTTLKLVAMEGEEDEDEE